MWNIDGGLECNAGAQIPRDTKYLLGFNEPNFASQSNMSPQEAAAAWKNVEAQLARHGLVGKIKVGTPSASPGGNMAPQEWYTTLSVQPSLVAPNAHSRAWAYACCGRRTG
jgi:hypothetical protein